MKNKYFVERESRDGKYIIVPADYDTFPFNTKNGGSYSVAPARILGLTYVEYLKFISSAFPEAVTIIGGDGLPFPVWRRGKEIHSFIQLLNAKTDLGVLEVIADAKRKYTEN